VPRRVVVADRDTLLDVALAHRLGFDNVARLNPEIDPWLPVSGTEVDLPTWSVLPEAAREGLVINLPELRMYDFTHPDGPAIYAIAIGDPAWPTPTGSFRAGRKRADPVWYVPDSIRSERPELPAAVPPGPANPLGSHWITIGASSYGLHGTNNPWSIGRLSTHGCVRLYDDVMRELFARLPAATPIRIVYQTLKLGSRNGRLHLEAHPDRYGSQPGAARELEGRLMVLRLLGVVEDDIERRRVERVVREARGVPVEIGRMARG
jgi:L,D-transpeptidase ErfK/SrfK